MDDISKEDTKNSKNCLTVQNMLLESNVDQGPASKLFCFALTPANVQQNKGHVRRMLCGCESEKAREEFCAAIAASKAAFAGIKHKTTGLLCAPATGGKHLAHAVERKASPDEGSIYPKSQRVGLDVDVCSRDGQAMAGDQSSAQTVGDDVRKSIARDQTNVKAESSTEEAMDGQPRGAVLAELDMRDIKAAIEGLQIQINQTQKTHMQKHGESLALLSAHSFALLSSSHPLTPHDSSHVM